MSVSNTQIISAYRQLLRKGLHAVQYSKPARYNLKRVLENAFRHGTPADFNTRKIGNTILFLSNAAQEKGLEHKIVKNLLIVRHWQEAYDSHKFEYAVGLKGFRLHKD